MPPRSDPRPDMRTVRLRKVLAFTGIAPLGAFVVVHLVTTATALTGSARFDRVFARSPVLTAATLVFVMAPLAFHAVWGTWLAIKQPRAMELPGWWPRLRRACSMTTLVFLIAHVIELPGRGWFGPLRGGSLYDVTTAHLSSTWHGFPFVAIAYLVGVAATLAHFATSLWTFFTAWGLVLAPRGRTMLAWGLATGAGLLFLVGGNTIVFLATGTRLVGPAPPAFVPDGPPPAPCSPKP